MSKNIKHSTIQLSSFWTLSTPERSRLLPLSGGQSHVPHLLVAVGRIGVVEKLTTVETWAVGQSFYFSSCWSSVIQVLSYFIIFHTQITWWIISQQELLLTMGTQSLNVISNNNMHIAVSSFFSAPQEWWIQRTSGHKATRISQVAKRNILLVLASKQLASQQLWKPRGCFVHRNL